MDVPKKLTLSCSRCRASKLKCDRKTPCSECVQRDCAYLCKKDERQPRARRSKSGHTEQIYNRMMSEKETEPEFEQTAQVLENFVDASLLGTSDSAVAPDIPNPYWMTSDPLRRERCLVLVRDIIKALPEWDIIAALYEIFVTRCQGPLGNVVHPPTFMKQAEQLHHCLSMTSSDEAIVSSIPMDSLAVLLLALVLGLAFHPISLLGAESPPMMLRVEKLRASDMPAMTWRSLGISCLQGRVSLFYGTISSLQAAIMILLDSQESALELDAILVSAISGARKLGLHRLGNAMLDASPPLNYSLSETTEPPHIRTEISIRIWWTLVMRDWSRGQALGYYTIHPTQFNTRLPLHINDEDLLQQGKISERPLSEFTMLSYTVHALKLVAMVRESIDLQGTVEEAAQIRQKLNQKYENYVASLPSYFRIGSTEGYEGIGPIPVQRFMLQQQLWSFLLRLHRATISTPMGRASCEQLANNIINIQAQLHARCTVCRSLSTNDTQLFNATVVLILIMLFDLPSREASIAYLSRMMTKYRIQEAIELLRAKIPPEGDPSSDVTSQNSLQTSVTRSVVALEALMNLERVSGDSKISLGIMTGPNNTNSIYGQVVEILKNLSDSASPNDQPATPGNISLHNFVPVADGFADLDVMPILSNNINADLWDFLDFQPSNEVCDDKIFGDRHENLNL